MGKNGIKEGERDVKRKQKEKKGKETVQVAGT